MAQYNKQNNSFLPNGTSLFEVVMLADAEGNINTGGGNFSGTAVDAFGRARMSQPITLFDSTNVGSESEDFYEVTTGVDVAPTFDEDNSTYLMSIFGQSCSILRRSRRRMSYQPGKSLLSLTTFTFAESQTHLKQRAGYYDDNDGVFFETEDGISYFVLRSSVSGSVVETRVAQADWNGDKLDGSTENSTSGFFLDSQKSQIFWTDIEWLGVGSVRCGFVINGQFILAHTFHHANQIDGTYMKKANLPVSYEIISDSSYQGGVATLKQICCSVISEGGYNATGLEYVASTALGGNTTNSTGWLNLVTAKLSDEEAIAVVSGIDILNPSNEDFEWGLFRNATFGSALAFGNALGSLVYDITDVDLATTGTRVAGGYLAGKTAPASFGVTNWEYQFTNNETGPETYTLAVRASGQSKHAAGMIKWTEH
jgi:hypothetical protein